MTFGVVGLGLGVVAAGLLIGFDVHRAWRLALIAPFYMGGMGIFQATGHT